MSAAIPAVTVDQMREVDRLAVEVYGLQLLRMMSGQARPTLPSPR